MNNLIEALYIDFSKYVIFNNKLMDKTVHNYLMNNESNFNKVFEQ